MVGARQEAVGVSQDIEGHVTGITRETRFRELGQGQPLLHVFDANHGRRGGPADLSRHRWLRPHAVDERNVRRLEWST